MSKKYLEDRIKRYKRLEKRIKNKDVELYERKNITIPITLVDWLKEHPEINFSSFCVKQTYKLKEQVDKQEFLDKNQDLIQFSRRKVKEYKKNDKNFDKRMKRVSDTIKAYFYAKHNKNDIVAEQSKQILERIAPEVFDHFDALEQYCKENPDYMDKDIPWEKITLKKYDV